MKIDENVLRDEILRLKKIVEEIQTTILRLEKVIGESDIIEPPDGIKKALLLCYKIRKKYGVTISKDDLYKLAKEVGYDMRGLGGLFVKGKSGEEAWLVKLPDDRVAITQKAVDKIEKYKEWLKSIES